MSRLLRKARYSWQVPTRLATERDEEKIAAWHEQTGALGVDVDGSSHTAESSATIAVAPKLFGPLLELMRQATA